MAAPSFPNEVVILALSDPHLEQSSAAMQSGNNEAAQGTRSSPMETTTFLHFRSTTHLFNTSVRFTRASRVTQTTRSRTLEATFLFYRVLLTLDLKCD